MNIAAQRSRYCNDYNYTLCQAELKRTERVIGTELMTFMGRIERENRWGVRGVGGGWRCVGGGRGG